MSTGAHPDYAAAPEPEEWKMRLYVTDWTPRCVAAFRNITKICEDRVNNRCNIEVVDLQEKPELARRDQIIAVPTLVKMDPEPKKVLVGDFSNVEKVLRALGVEILSGGRL
jgi:circadian clock protein KaiB